ncbi:TIGR03086 family protein [Streptomyces triticagri]|uniref:TIGR03086 family protein n=1 Tax=Streptomyces triticagri TaxID=2293568 RepID=A0A372LUS9_9ACTN|nr:TIGR03086 family metal-binding protein [Streptomyces triticagri]RFU82416.1 TIGR03086 family protein [Streptomyces triticagri]
MDETVDFHPQTRAVAHLAAAVRDEQLTDPTPCEDFAVRNLLGHLTGLAAAFRDAGRKDLGPTTDTSPDTAKPDIGPDWRAELAENLQELAEAWRAPEAWTGDTRAGGLDLPGAVAGQIAMDELILHGWDLARATGQPYAPDPAGLEVAHALLAASPDGPEREGMFGPIVPVPADAPLLDRVVGLSGRRPDWTAG